jgi:hypothetical protein
MLRAPDAIILRESMQITVGASLDLLSPISFTVLLTVTFRLEKGIK